MKNGCTSSFISIAITVFMIAFAIDQIKKSENKQIIITILAVGGLIIFILICIAVMQGSPKLKENTDVKPAHKHEDKYVKPANKHEHKYVKPANKHEDKYVKPANKHEDKYAASTPAPSNSETSDKQYLDYCYKTSNRIVGFARNVMKDQELFQAIKDINGIEVLDTDMYKGCNSRVAVIILHDLWKCYVGSGHNISDQEDFGNLCYSLAAYRLTNGEEFPRNLILLEEGREPLQSIGCGTMELAESLGVQGFEGPTSFLMEFMINHLGRDSSKYRKFLYNVTKCMNSYGTLTEEAKEYLEELKPTTEEKKTEETLNCETSMDNDLPPNDRPRGIDQLDELVGLESVKTEIRKLSSFVQVQQWRAKEGLRSPVVSYHCVFTGNPGTGKTTVARIIADIYRELGLLKKGQLVETDRSGLVGEYVGHTAVKTNKIIDTALDGVLFIDEAYSLITDEYGQEAISTLLKRMEDDRDRLVVIIAGYNDEMRRFIESNPGLKSRFNRYFHFENSTPEQLCHIMQKMFSKHDYIVEEEAAIRIKEILESVITKGDKGFGNARFVRNLFERILENQALRLSSEGSYERSALQRITLPDVSM